MNIQTSKILISKRTYDSFHENWNSNEEPTVDPNILDSGISSQKGSFKVTLRIPMQLQGSNGYMLIKAKLLFTRNKNQIALATLCSFTKPLIFSFFLGFLTSLFFVFPYCFFSKLNLIVPFLAGIVISAIYFWRFYLKIQRISDPYLIELENKYMNL